MQLLARLPAAPLRERGGAVEPLLRSASPAVRERALGLGAVLLAESTLVDWLRNEVDAVLRNAAAAILERRGARSFPLAVRLLADPEPDVVVAAVLLLDRLRDPRALAPLRALLASTDRNVVSAAIVAIGHLGDAGAIPDLLPFLGADSWLQLAAIEALADLRARRAVPPLAALLEDRVVGPSAAEALARIGGIAACGALAERWRRSASRSAASPAPAARQMGRQPVGGYRKGGEGSKHREEAEEGQDLALLAQVLETLPRPPAGREELLASLEPRLADPWPSVRAAAARSVLALGPSAGDQAALAILAAGRAAAGGGEPTLPAALRRRPDLIGTLLGLRGAARGWGFSLAALFPRLVPLHDLARALPEAGDSHAPGNADSAVGNASNSSNSSNEGDIGESAQALAAAIHCLRRLPAAATADRELAAAVLDLYLGLAAERRADLAPACKRFRLEMSADLAARAEVDEVDRTVLAARLGLAPRRVAARLVRLPLASRLAAVSQLTSHAALMRVLPWSSWLREAPDACAGVAAEAAAASRLSELLPLLRAVPPRLAVPPLLRAFAEMQDRAAVPRLLEMLSQRPDLRPLVLASLGRIGGPQARRALAAMARTTDGAEVESRLALRALSLCAGQEDQPLFRAAASHPDWYIRMACAEVLGRFSDPRNRELLALLAADPVPAVARQALAQLDG
jgi:HEAT repeat protein